MKNQTVLKHLVLLAFVFAVSSFDTQLFAQTKVKSKEKEQVFTLAEEMPVFPGGEEAMVKYIAINTKYPEAAQKEGVSGRVFIEFIIDKNGKVTDAEVKRGVRKDLDDEALRVINSMPDWAPGKHSGKNVAVRFTIPVNYKLRDPKEAKQ